jgi:hypothetical protein
MLNYTGAERERFPRIITYALTECIVENSNLWFRSSHRLYGTLHCQLTTSGQCTVPEPHRLETRICDYATTEAITDDTQMAMFILLKLTLHLVLLPMRDYM